MDVGIGTIENGFRKIKTLTDFGLSNVFYNLY